MSYTPTKYLVAAVDGVAEILRSKRCSEQLSTLDGLHRNSPLVHMYREQKAPQVGPPVKKTNTKAESGQDVNLANNLHKLP